jgi:hypothetical protein
VRIIVVMTIYNEGSRCYQDRFDTRLLAGRLEERFLSRPTIDKSDRAFIEGATADADGRPQCSYKTPVRAWKTREWASDVPSADDPANAPDAEIVER